MKHPIVPLAASAAAAAVLGIWAAGILVRDSADADETRLAVCILAEAPSNDPASPLHEANLRASLAATEDGLAEMYEEVEELLAAQDGAGEQPPDEPFRGLDVVDCPGELMMPEQIVDSAPVPVAGVVTEPSGPQLLIFVLGDESAEGLLGPRPWARAPYQLICPEQHSCGEASTALYVREDFVERPDEVLQLIGYGSGVLYLLNAAESGGWPADVTSEK